jgi:hypothetical protein
MVSGLVTSPCDQLRIFSGDASMMRIASKSVIGLDSSNGFERNKATLLGGPNGRCRGFFPGFLMGPSFPGSGVCRFQEGPQKTVVSDQLSVASSTVVLFNFVDRHHVEH